MSDSSGFGCDSGPRNEPKMLHRNEQRENIASSSSIFDSSSMLNGNKGEDTSSQQSQAVAIYEFPKTDKLTELLLCSNCRSIVIPSDSSYFCEAGHYLCTPCGKKSGINCPVMEAGEIQCFLEGTRSKLSVGGFPLYETIFKAAEFNCKYAAAGCKENVYSDTMDSHQRDCKFRPEEECLFNDCAKFRFLELLLDHYESIHRVKIFTQNHMSIAVLYDRPEIAEPLGKRFRWVSFIFRYFQNHFFITVEKCKGDWMIWAYALNDQPNLDSVKINLHLQDNVAGKIKLVGVLDVHSRSVSSEEIIKTNKYVKMTADEMESNLYLVHDTKQKGTFRRYLLFDFTILIDSRPAEKIVEKASIVQFGQKKVGEYNYGSFQDEYRLISDRETAPKLKGRLEIPAGYGRPNTLNIVSEVKVTKLREECIFQAEDESRAETQPKEPGDKSEAKDKDIKEESDESIVSIVQIASSQEVKSHEEAKSHGEVKSIEEPKFQEVTMPSQEEFPQAEAKPPELQDGEKLQRNKSPLEEARPTAEAKSHEEMQFQEEGKSHGLTNPQDEANPHEKDKKPRDETKFQEETKPLQGVKPPEEAKHIENEKLKEEEISEEEATSQEQEKLPQREKLHIEESPLAIPLEINQSENVNYNVEAVGNQEMDYTELFEKQSDMKNGSPCTDDLSVSTKVNHDLKGEKTETRNEAENKELTVETIGRDDESDCSSGDDEYEDAQSEISYPTKPPHCNVA